MYTHVDVEIAGRETCAEAVPVGCSHDVGVFVQVPNDLLDAPPAATAMGFNFIFSIRHPKML